LRLGGRETRKGEQKKKKGCDGQPGRKKEFSHLSAFLGDGKSLCRKRKRKEKRRATRGENGITRVRPFNIYHLVRGSTRLTSHHPSRKRAEERRNKKGFSPPPSGEKKVHPSDKYQRKGGGSNLAGGDSREIRTLEAVRRGERRKGREPFRTKEGEASFYRSRRTLLPPYSDKIRKKKREGGGKREMLKM